MTDTTITDNERQRILAREISKYVKSGWATESTTANQAVLVKVKKIGLFWNVVLTFITGGIWLIWIIYRALNRKSTRVVLYVDENGKIIKR